MKSWMLVLACLVATSYCFVNRVVDISHYTKAEFDLIKKDGIVGVIHKATQGVSYTDPMYHERRPQAERAGLLWGAFHFGSGGESGTQQADFFLDTVGDYTSVLLALDAEPNGKFTIGQKEAEEFVERVLERTGRYPLLYGSTSFLSKLLAGSQVLRKCGLWIANYTTNQNPKLPNGKTSWVLWQYTDGRQGGSPKYVNGIGYCDRDRYSGSDGQLVSSWPNL